jgi:hypothetical protein
MPAVYALVAIVMTAAIAVAANAISHKFVALLSALPS